MSMGIHGGFWGPGKYGLSGEVQRISKTKIRITITCAFPDGNWSGRIRQGDKPNEFIFETKHAGCILKPAKGMSTVTEEFTGKFAKMKSIVLIDSDGRNDLPIS